MKLKFVSGLIQIASLRFVEALKGSKITMNELGGSYVTKASSNMNYRSRIAGALMTHPPLLRLKTGSKLGS